MNITLAREEEEAEAASNRWKETWSWAEIGLKIIYFNHRVRWNLCEVSAPYLRIINSAKW